MAELRSTQPTPRWLYRFLYWMRSTPLNGVLFAIALFLIGAGLSHWASWQSGSLARYQFDTQLLFPAIWLPANLLFWIWLDSIARNAINDFANGTGKSKPETEKIYDDFISIGTTLSLVLLIAGLALGYVDSAARAAAYGVTQPALVLLTSAIPILGGVVETLSVFRLFRQLFLVNKLYKNVKRINLFNLWPIYALSRYGYTLALLFIVATVIIDIAFRLLGGADLPVGIIIYTLVISLIVFIAPLMGINRRIRREKEQELQRLGTQLNTIYDETEAAVRARKLAKVTPLRSAAGALKEQMDAVQKVATWPWNPGSLRNLFLPILLPLFIAILQRYVLTFLGF